MSDEVIIPFGTKALDVAKARAKEILGLAKEAAKEIKDKIARKDFLANAKAQAKATLAQGKERARVGALSSGFDARGVALSSATARGFAKINEAQAKAATVFAAVADFRSQAGALRSIGTIAGLFGGPYGQVVNVASQIVAHAISGLEKRIEARQKAEARALLARVEQRLRETDYRTRLERDAAFRAQEERRTRFAFQKEREDGRGWHPRSARFAEVQ